MDGSIGSGGGADVFGSSTAPLTWHDFLERMRHPSAADFVKAIKRSVDPPESFIPTAWKKKVKSEFASEFSLVKNVGFVLPCLDPLAYVSYFMAQNIIELCLDRNPGKNAALFSFIVSFSNKVPDPEKDSAAVQEFLANMEMAFRAHSLWAGCSEEELESAGEGLEKYVMTKLFNHAFASLPEDVKHDDELHEKMALIQQFIRPENLDIEPAFRNETSWLLAQKELQKINMYKAPRDKLVCILNCCKVINNLLLNASLASSDNPPGADEFLPVLIFVTIKANPPQLHSNLLYIQRYRRQSRLVSEAAYFFTNILSAESFIWNIDANSLSMDEAEYQKNMESAKAVLSGVSYDLVNQLNQIDQERSSQSQQTGFKDRTVEAMKMKMDLNIYSSSTGDNPSKLDIREQSTVNKQTFSYLERKGAADIMEEDHVSIHFQDYPFLHAQVDDLTIADVEHLLNNYKQLVFKYVCLCKGMNITDPSRPLLPVQNEPPTGEMKGSEVTPELDTRVEDYGEIPTSEGASNEHPTEIPTPEVEISTDELVGEAITDEKSGEKKSDQGE